MMCKRVPKFIRPKILLLRNKICQYNLIELTLEETYNFLHDHTNMISGNKIGTTIDAQNLKTALIKILYTVKFYQEFVEFIETLKDADDEDLMDN